MDVTDLGRVSGVGCYEYGTIGAARKWKGRVTDMERVARHGNGMPCALCVARLSGGRGLVCGDVWQGGGEAVDLRYGT